MDMSCRLIHFLSHVLVSCVYCVNRHLITVSGLFIYLKIKVKIKEDIRTTYSYLFTLYHKDFFLEEQIEDTNIYYYEKKV